MRVQHNIAAMNSYRNYNNNTKSINKNLEKLSSGYKINRAGDDAAGLAISEKMRAQITGLEGAQKNAKDGISLVQTAEGALTEVHSMLNRMYSLAEQSANGTYDDDIDRAQLQKEVTALVKEIDRIRDGSNFNGKALLDGSMAAADVSVKDPASPTLTGVSLGKITWDSGLSADDKTAAMTAIAAGSLTVKAEDSTGSGGDPDSYTLTASGFTVSGTFAADGSSSTLTLKSSDGSKTYGTITVKADAAASTKTDGNTAAFTFEQKGSGSGLQLQIGDTSDSYNQLNVSIQDIKSTELGIDSTKVDISTQTGAASSLNAIKDAINTISDIRGDLGATQNRLEHTINNLSVMQENLQDAESTIRDTDVADEMMKYTKNSILVQSAQAMLAQANQQPQGVLQLLQ